MGRTVWWILGLGVVLCSPPRLLADQGVDTARAIRADSGSARAGDSDRPRAVQHSDAYYTRLSIHRVGSYVILPLFAGEYFLGNKLLDGGNVAGWVKPTHSVGAYSIAAVFAVNTVTGLWNFLEARHESEGKARRLTHLVLMLASEAGFVYTASLAGDAGEDHEGGVRHRNAALASIGLSTVGTVMMWLWKN
jgi:hypothetical protein